MSLSVPELTKIKQILKEDSNQTIKQIPNNEIKGQYLNYYFTLTPWLQRKILFCGKDVNPITKDELNKALKNSQSPHDILSNVKYK